MNLLEKDFKLFYWSLPPYTKEWKNKFPNHETHFFMHGEVQKESFSH